MNTDYIVHATAADGQVRVFASLTKDMVEEARKIHGTSPTATAALGRLLTAGSMMGSMMKGQDDLLTLQIKCDGPIGGLTVTARSDGSARGYVVNPAADLPPKAKGKLNVGGAVGAGILSVIRDMGMKEPYTGQVNLVGGEIAEDITYYYAASEQINSSVGLGVLVDTDGSVKQAGGFILQLMPFAEDGLIRSLEENLKDIPPVTTMLESGMSPEDIISRILKGYDVSFYNRLGASYRCECSRERVERAIVSIGKKDIQEMIDDGKPIEVNCRFCGKNYVISPDELKTLLERANG